MDRRALLGKINYAGYCKTAGTTHDGKPLPEWEDLLPRTQEAWTAGGESVVQALLCSFNKEVEDSGNSEL